MRRRAGMTLIEVLVALALAGIVTATGYTVFSASIDARQRTRGVLEPVSRAMAARVLLTNWIGAAHTTGREDGIEFNGADVTGMDVADVVTFLTHDARPMIAGRPPCG